MGADLIASVVARSLWDDQPLLRDTCPLFKWAPGVAIDKIYNDDIRELALDEDGPYVEYCEDNEEGVMNLNPEDYEPEGEMTNSIDGDDNETANDINDNVGGNIDNKDVGDINIVDKVVVDIPVLILDDVQRVTDVTFGPPLVEYIVEHHHPFR